MKEYFYENKKVDIGLLEANFMDNENYSKAHQELVIVCNDIFIKYRGGILLVKRKNLPDKDSLYPVGGRILRGKSIEDSLKIKTKEECNLELDNISEIGYARTFFRTDPFGHGKGTDTINLVYFGQGKGRIKLNNFHKNYVIIKKEEYTEEFKENLHPYVEDFMNKVISFL